jgi:hypothetical protein
MKIGQADVWAWGWHQQRIGGGERELPSEIRWYDGTRKAGLRWFHLEGYSNIFQPKIDLQLHCQITWPFHSRLCLGI